jgi:hypothetical protein
MTPKEIKEKIFSFNKILVEELYNKCKFLYDVNDPEYFWDKFPEIISIESTNLGRDLGYHERSDLNVCLAFFHVKGWKFRYYEGLLAFLSRDYGSFHLKKCFQTDLKDKDCNDLFSRLEKNKNFHSLENIIAFLNSNPKIIVRITRKNGLEVYEKYDSRYDNYNDDDKKE